MAHATFLDFALSQPQERPLSDPTLSDQQHYTVRSIGASSEKVRTCPCLVGLAVFLVVTSSSKEPEALNTMSLLKVGRAPCLTMFPYWSTPHLMSNQQDYPVSDQQGYLLSDLIMVFQTQTLRSSTDSPLQTKISFAASSTDISRV